MQLPTPTIPFFTVKYLSYGQLTLPSYNKHMNYTQQPSSPDWVWRTCFNISFTDKQRID